MKKILAVFDFDHTLVDDNTDIVARSLVPKEALKHAEELYTKTNSWTLYMREIFRAFFVMNIPKELLIKSIQQIPPIPHMDTLLKRLIADDNFEVIIISDSNSFFINEWLQIRRFEIQAVITNPAWFDDEGLLNIEFYQHQTFCELSEPNLCKGDAMTKYINERRVQGISFDSVIMVGDGGNDYCPTLKLTENDYVFPRYNYKLFKKVTQNQSLVKAKIKPWNNGDDIIKVLEKEFKLVALNE